MEDLHAAALAPAIELAARGVPEVAAQIDVAVGSLDERVAADGICRGGRRCVGWLSARLGAVEPCEHRVVKRCIVAVIADLIVVCVVSLVEHDVRALEERKVRGIVVAEPERERPCSVSRGELIMQ